MRFGTFVACCGALQATLLVTPVAWGQGAPALPNIGDALRESEESRKPPLPPKAPAPVLPQLVEPQLILKDNETLFVRRFEIDGPKDLVGDAEVRKILEPYENRQLTLAQIYEAADKITTLYRNQGYLVAKAYVPAQDTQGSVLRIKVIPGRHGTTTLKNESLVRDDYLQGVIDRTLGGASLIHKDPIERAMLLVYDLPGGGLPRLTIGPGQQPETSDFVFGVPEGRRFDGYVLGDNYGSPFTGRNRLTAGFNLNSPFGYGDRLSAFGIVSAHSDLVNGRVAYSFPLGYSGLRGEIAALRTTYALGGIYTGLDATGNADVVTGTLTYPIVRRRDDTIYLSGSVAHKSLDDKILGTSFAHRNIDLGAATISRDTIGALAGLPFTTNTAFSFTAGHVDFPDSAQSAANSAGVNTVGDYSRINFSFNAALAFTEKVSLSVYLRAQKSLSGNLDSSEQMGLTGAWGVRSYDEVVSGDSGYLVTPELKYALPDIASYRHAISLFTDIGEVRFEDSSFTTQKSSTQLKDVGLGYSATYEYSPGRFLLLKAQLAHSYGSNDGAQSYDQGTKGLLQVGLTF